MESWNHERAFGLVDGVRELGNVLVGGGLTLFGAPPLALLPYPVLVRGGRCRFLDVLLPVRQQLVQVPVVGKHVLRLPACGVERDLRALKDSRWLCAEADRVSRLARRSTISRSWRVRSASAAWRALARRRVM